MAKLKHRKRHARHPGQNPAAAEAFKKDLAQKLESLPIQAGPRVKVWVMDEARFGLHTELRRVWITKGVRPEVKRQTRYTWDYLYGALEEVEGAAVFAHLPTVSLECNDLFLREIIKMDPDAQHVVIADQAGFHLRPGDERVPEGVHLIALPPYSPELNPCEQLWDVIKDSEGVDNGPPLTIVHAFFVTWRALVSLAVPWMPLRSGQQKGL
jgi:hypothetical protein